MAERIINVPFAMFRFDGEVVEMTKAQFDQALRDSRHCSCKACLVCRVAEYARSADYPEAPKQYNFKRV